MVQALRIGLSQDVFWRMTPRELYREFAAAKLRAQDRFEHATTIAFQTVRVWVLTKNKKKMPKFSDLVRSSEPSEVSQSPEQARAVMELLAARMGGRVRKRTS